jgi:RHS repeat-associated protein
MHRPRPFAFRAPRLPAALLVGLLLVLVAATLPVLPEGFIRASEAATVEPVYPPATGTQPASALADFDPAKATVVRRSETATIYRRTDGWETAMINSAPVNWRAGDGSWHAIDTRLERGRDGSLHNASGPVSMVFADRTGPGDLVRLSGDGWSVGFSPDGGAPGRAALVTGSTVVYPEVFPHVDLEYQVGPDGLKEVFVVKDRAGVAGVARVRFPLHLSGVEVGKGDGDEIALIDRSGRRVARVPKGNMADAAGSRGGVAVTSVANKSAEAALDVVADVKWANERSRVFPLRVDPDIWYGFSTSGFDAYASSVNTMTNYDGENQRTANGYVDKAGYEQCWGCEEFYSYQQFDLSPVKDRQIVSATWKDFVWRKRGTGEFTLWAAADPWTAGSIKWGPGGSSLPHHRDDAAGRKNSSVQTGGITAEVDVTDWVRKWFDPNGWPNFGVSIDTAGKDSYVEFSAMEDANRPRIEVTYNPGPPVSYARSFGADTITTTTPTITASTVPGVQYAFRVATSADGDSQPVVTSPAQASPSWTVPAGILQDGGVYYIKVYTYNGSAWASASPMRVGVNLRLGDGKVSPIDQFGPVNVNLATGNVFYRHASPTFSTVGGPLGVSFSYNSQAPPAYGLSGAYYGNCDGSQPWVKAPPTARRHDIGNGSTWNMSWSGAPVPGSVTSDAFCVRWTGYLTVPHPAAGSAYYAFDVGHDDAVKMYLDEKLYIDQGGVGTAHGGQLHFTDKQTVPITIELIDTGGPASIGFTVYGTENGGVPVSWLSVSPPALPTGWNSSLDTTATLAYTSAVIDADSSLVSLLGPGGEVSMFAADPSGTAWQPLNGDASTLTKNAGTGELIVQGEDGMTYVFDARGKLRSATSARDRTNITAPLFSYDEKSGRLSRVEDPLSNPDSLANHSRRMDLIYYSTPGTCPTKGGFDGAPPSGHLCEVKYSWDNTSTKLYYQSGRLAAIEDPGSSAPGVSDSPEETRFDYDAGGRLAKIRDVLASDYANRGVRTDNDLLRTVVSYTGDRVASITLPEPEPGKPQPKRVYRYVSSAETQVDVIGLTQPSGSYRKVSFDGGGRTTSETDATDLTTIYSWKDGDLLFSRMDPASLWTFYTYDVSGRVVNELGPAPESCFDDRGEGFVASCPSKNKTSTTHDAGAEGNDSLNGLAATFWDGGDEFAGKPNGETREFSTPITVSKTWTSANNPAGVVGDEWAGRFTGVIDSPVIQWVTFQLDNDPGDRARLYIDDKLVIDRWSGTGPNQKDVGLSAAQHRIRIDYVDTGAGAPGGGPNASLTLSWFHAADVIDGPVSTGYVHPNYGLVTAVTDPDGHVTRTEYNPAELGLATATIGYTGPYGTGTPLRTETEYNTFYRQPTSKRLPHQTALGGPKTTYSYYGNNEPVPAGNECGENAIQAGFLNQATETSGIVRLYLYDERGRQVGTKVQGDARWTCTVFDQRGRTTSITDRAGRTTTLTRPYVEPAKVTTTFLDTANPPVIRTTEQVVDLLGRMTRYKDENGSVTTYSYDQAGRLSGTSRALPNQPVAPLTTGQYDAAGRLTSLTEQASGIPRTTSYSYNAGRLATTTRPNGTTTSRSYDDSLRGDLTSIAHARATTPLSTWNYTTNLSGTVAAETETITGRSRAFTYDGAGRLTRTVQGAITRNYAYDENSNRCGNSTNCAGAYTYDNADRLIGSTDPRYSTLQYDNGSGNPTAHGNLTRMGNTLVTYDTNDHATVIDDGVIKVEEILSPSGRVLERKVTDHATPPQVKEWVVFGYDGPGDSPTYQETTSATGPNWSAPLKLTDDWKATSPSGNDPAWKAANWTTSSTTTTGAVDIQGNKGRIFIDGTQAQTEAKATANPSLTNSEVALTYHFQSRNVSSELRVGLRATGSSSPNNASYRVDVQSNSSSIRLRKKVSGASSAATLTSFTYNTNAAPQRLRFRVTNDANGQPLLQAKVWNASQPEPANWSVQYPDTATDKITGAGTLQLTHSSSSAANSAFVENLTYADATRTRTTYLQGADGLGVMDTNGEATYQHTNGHGDIAGTSDVGGAYTPVTMTDEYGKGAPTANRLGWLGANQRFTAHNGSSLMRMGVRLYDPNLGRFLSVDPIEGGSCTNYDYVCGDPVNRFDFAGTICWSCPVQWVGKQIFKPRNKHFVERGSKPGLHWDNHQNRLEYDRTRGWHFNDGSKPGSHDPAWRGIAKATERGIGNVLGGIGKGVATLIGGIGNTSIIPLCTYELCGVNDPKQGFTA